MTRLFHCHRLVCLAIVVFAAARLSAGTGYRVGLARTDITPQGSIRMAGYGARLKPSEGVDLPLQAKVLALQHENDKPVFLITADLIGFTRDVTEDIVAQLQKKTDVPRQQFLLVASHTHAGPVIGLPRKRMFDLQGKEAEVVEKYKEQVVRRIVEAVGKALEKMEPATLSFGRGHATFAVNRRIFRSAGVTFGANYDGAVDHSVPVLRIDGADGKVRGIVFGYACHCTTLMADHLRICGDWAGFAQEYLERAHPGATALFVTGCAGDADPQPRGQLEFARQHGLEMAGAVSQVLSTPRVSVQGEVRSAFERVDLPFAPAPTRAEFQKRLNDRSPYVQRHARRHLDMLDRGEKFPASYPCPVQVWQFGKDLTLVALGGEVVVDYALRLKREIKDTNLWIVGYSNDLFAYVPSVRILLEGGYEADASLIGYGLPGRFANEVEDVLVSRIRALVKQVR